MAADVSAWSVRRVDPQYERTAVPQTPRLIDTCEAPMAQTQWSVSRRPLRSSSVSCRATEQNSLDLTVMAIKARKVQVAKLQILPATSITAAFDAAMRWIDSISDPGYFWFRGTKDSRLDLLPGAYWRTNYREWEPLLDFIQEGRAYADVGELGDWRTYYLAQHQGIPTRLLDWTESFLTALFFALDHWDGKTTPSVWILRPE